MNRISKIFQPLLIIPKNAVVKNQDLTSKSQRLMMECGLIRPSGNGSFFILPILQRSVEKLVGIIDHHMQKIDCQKITMPTLTSADLWKMSGRFEDAQSELLIVKDRHEKLHLLSPTHEESITSLLASIAGTSYRLFPLKFYQITSKFRDEMKPRFGLIRAKEFLMKDLYTFDCDLESAKITYETVNEQYKNLFDYLEIPYVKIEADTGLMGGNISHEYHILTSIGEDHIVQCKKCNKAVNKELLNEKQLICDECVPEDIEQHEGIEIGHTFVLEDKYTKALNATYLSKKGKPEILQMGCYGIGVTRLIAASIERFSTESEIRWPIPIAPFKLCIIPPKEGSKEQEKVKDLMEEIDNFLKSTEKSLRDDVVIDDRTQITIGKRLMHTKRLGIPFIIVIGSKAAEEINPTVELHDLNQNIVHELSITDALNKVMSQIKTYEIV